MQSDIAGKLAKKIMALSEVAWDHLADLVRDGKLDRNIAYVIGLACGKELLGVESLSTNQTISMELLSAHEINGGIVITTLEHGFPAEWPWGLAIGIYLSDPILGDSIKAIRGIAEIVFDEFEDTAGQPLDIATAIMKYEFECADTEAAKLAEGKDLDGEIHGMWLNRTLVGEI